MTQDALISGSPIEVGASVQIEFKTGGDHRALYGNVQAVGAYPAPWLQLIEQQYGRATTVFLGAGVVVAVMKQSEAL